MTLPCLGAEGLEIDSALVPHEMADSKFVEGIGKKFPAERVVHPVVEERKVAGVRSKREVLHRAEAAEEEEPRQQENDECAMLPEALAHGGCPILLPETFLGLTPARDLSKITGWFSGR